ncbi:class I SAM-dependent methyltransferase [Rhodospirillaceae bacterium SYSU D60014]|uniref:class I SAM-dependent methyltransferase n=1 Tax=Virgifigura deserti TaxID=2268457 RepID=UPI000E662F78
MSRLDSFIRRLEAQRACLDHAADLIRDLPGRILEIGLGNGRTYDHLRKLLPDREIFVFDRQIAAHPDCIPPAGYFLPGDLRETLPIAAQLFGPTAALIHADIGTGDVAANRQLAAALGPTVARLLMPGGVAVSDQPMPCLAALPLPSGVAVGRYHLYRSATA